MIVCPTYMPLNFEGDPDHRLDTRKVNLVFFPFTGLHKYHRWGGGGGGAS